MSKRKRMQWHPAFCSAMELELMEDAQYLNYTNEYNLNTKPLQMDLLIVKKKQDIELKNEIGKLFRKHNIVEYKSPDDSMNLNTYLKVLSYALLYKTLEIHVDDIKLNEITITLVRDKNPKKLLTWFENNSYQIIQKYPGIYYIEKDGHFPTQLIVSGELSKENQKWLTLLSNDLDEKDAERALSQLQSLSEEDKDRLGSSVLQVAENANKKLFKKIKEDAKRVLRISLSDLSNMETAWTIFPESCKFHLKKSKP